MQQERITKLHFVAMLSLVLESRTVLGQDSQRTASRAWLLASLAVSPCLSGSCPFLKEESFV
jgi:hypothetical protein